MTDEKKPNGDSRYAARGVEIRMLQDPEYPDGLIGFWRYPTGHQLAGKRAVVRLQSRRTCEPHSKVKGDLRWGSGILVLEIPDGSPDQPPLWQPLKITREEQLVQIKGRTDQKGRQVYRLASRGVTCYLDFEERVLGEISPAKPYWAVGTKGAYCYLTRSEEYVELLSEYAEEGRLPDLTLLRSGGMTIHIIDFQSMRVGRPGEKEGQWQFTEVVPIRTLLDLSCDIPSTEELEEKHVAACAVYARYSDEFLAELETEGAITANQRQKIAEFRDINRKKLDQAHRIVKKRIAANQRTTETILGKGRAATFAMRQALAQGNALKAPPPTAALAATNMSLTERIQEWGRILQQVFPDIGLIEGESVREWGSRLFSAAFAAGMGEGLPSQLDDDNQVVAMFFENTGFPKELRWPLFVYIRVSLQGREAQEFLNKDLIQPMEEEDGTIQSDAAPAADTDKSNESPAAASPAPEAKPLLGSWENWLKKNGIRKVLALQLASSSLTPQQFAALELNDRIERYTALGIDAETANRLERKFEQLLANLTAPATTADKETEEDEPIVEPIHRNGKEPVDKKATRKRDGKQPAQRAKAKARARRGE